ncbi:MAG: endonuclease/exonuclease/phosphatase [Thermoleophilia bacterium]|nr:endonuclease/exonuclease/phosphatase [Thermoleophilia bacterium]
MQATNIAPMSAPAPSWQPQPWQPPVVRDVDVLTINVKAFQLSDGGVADERAFDALERYITRVDPDVVLLQELDDNTARSGRADQLAEIARRTGASDAQFGAAMAYDGGRYGIGMITRNGYTIRDAAPGMNDTHVVPLPRGQGDKADPEQRVALVAPIVAPDGQEVFTAITTHLANRSPGRDAQLRRLDEVVGDVRDGAAQSRAAVPSDYPRAVVLGGDFNTMRFIADRRLGDRLTHVGALDSHLGWTKIDHLYVSDELHARDAHDDRAESVVEHWLPFGIGDVRSTDHKSLRATIGVG